MLSSASPGSTRPLEFEGHSVPNFSQYRAPTFTNRRGRRNARNLPAARQDPSARRGSAPNLYPFPQSQHNSSLPGAPLPLRSDSVCTAEDDDQEVDIQLRMDPSKFRALWSDPSRFTDMGLELESDFGNRSSDSGEYSADEGSWVGSIASNWTKSSKAPADAVSQVRLPEFSYT